MTGVADLYQLTWCTTWWRVANERIAPLVGLPTDLPAVRLPGAWSNVPLGFSAKTLWLRRHANGRAVAWVDDDIDERDNEALTRALATDDRSHLAGAEPCVAALVLNADPDVGLTVDHVERLRRWGEARRPGALEQAALRERHRRHGETTWRMLGDDDVATLTGNPDEPERQGRARGKHSGTP